MLVETIHIVDCDCGIQVTADADYFDTDHLEETLRDYGWICEDHGNTCPACQGMGDEWMKQAEDDDLWVRGPAPKKRSRHSRMSQKAKG